VVNKSNNNRSCTGAVYAVLVGLKLPVQFIQVNKPLAGVGLLLRPIQNVCRFEKDRLPRRGRDATRPSPADGREFVTRKIPIIRHAHQRIFIGKVQQILIGACQRDSHAPGCITLIQSAEIFILCLSAIYSAVESIGAGTSSNHWPGNESAGRSPAN